MIAMTAEKARRLAEEWIAAWNSRDLAAILRCYAEDSEFTSSTVVALGGSASGTAKGKAALAQIFAAGLRAHRIDFDLHGVLLGVGTVVILYRGIRGDHVVEVHQYDADDKITRAVVYHSRAG